MHNAQLTFSADHDLGFQLFDVAGEAGRLAQLFIILALANKVLEGRKVEGEFQTAARTPAHPLTVFFLCPQMADLRGLIRVQLA